MQLFQAQLSFALGCHVLMEMDSIKPEGDVVLVPQESLGTIGQSRSMEPNPAGCCETVRVIYDEGDADAFQARPEVFQTYTIEPELLNGKVRYTSEDGTHVISYCDRGIWQIQPVSVM